MTPRDSQYVTGVERYPEIDAHFESNVKGLHIIGAANGSQRTGCDVERSTVSRSSSKLRARAISSPVAATTQLPPSKIVDSHATHIYSPSSRHSWERINPPFPSPLRRLIVSTSK